jgi:hypothetical protein
MSKKLILILALVLGSASCDSSSPAAPALSSNSPEFGTGNGPSSAGPFVVRSNDGIFLTSVDEAQDLVVRHYNTEDIDFCGGGTPAPTAEAQLVFTANAAVYVWQTGELPVYVYRLSEVPPQEDVTRQFCKALKEKWIYRGTHQLTNHDNNLFGEPGRQNSFGWNAQGTVFDRLGKKYSYGESLLIVFDTDTGRELSFKYSLAIK